MLYSQAVISISGITAFFIPPANSRFFVESLCHFEQKKICTRSAKVAQGLLTDNIQKPSALPSKSDLLEKNNTRNALATIRERSKPLTQRQFRDKVATNVSKATKKDY